MRASSDHRWALVPKDAKHCLYVHRPAGLTNDDAVAGPFLHEENERISNEDIYRVRMDGTAERLGLQSKFLDYEVVKPTVDANISEARARVDQKLLWAGPVDDALADRFAAARNHITSLIEPLFKYVLCSMTRIVASASVSNDEWIMVTTRDQEKVPGEEISFCYVRSISGNRFEWVGSQKIVPTSSSTMCVSFHKAMEHPGVLLHTHAIFPVLFDDCFSGVDIIDLPPREAQFGVQIAQLLKRNRSVLRRSEGIWCFGSSTDEILSNVRWHQAKALSRILQ